MAKKEDKKGLFGKAFDKLSSKDEKEEISKLEEELAKAKQEAEQAKARAKELVSQNVETRMDKSGAEKELSAAEKRIEELEKQLKEKTQKELEEKKEERLKELREKIQKPVLEKKTEIITVHTVESNNQTLSHIALKYYNHATPPYWQYLLEHNKEVLKGSEKNVRMGMKLEIPELPDELKD
jgi:chromosome segregation ATPase